MDPCLRLLLPGGGVTEWAQEISPDGRIHYCDFTAPTGRVKVEIRTEDHPPVLREVEIREGENDLEIPFP